MLPFQLRFLLAVFLCRWSDALHIDGRIRETHPQFVQQFTVKFQKAIVRLLQQRVRSQKDIDVRHILLDVDLVPHLDFGAIGPLAHIVLQDALGVHALVGAHTHPVPVFRIPCEALCNGIPDEQRIVKVAHIHTARLRQRHQ